MDFQSPRFAGDPLLNDILNDPDTGQLKLGPGSPAASVKALQQALWDLHWAAAVAPELHNVDFVIGIYGPITKKAVRRFKENYGIHFPPDDPAGFVDEFAGPRTFRKLDPLCVNLDAGSTAMFRKFVALKEAGVEITLPKLPDPQAPRTRPIVGTHGSSRQVFLGDDDSGHLYFRRELGAFLVEGDLDHHYRTVLGGPSGSFGFPVADQLDLGDGTQVGEFEGGTLTLDVASGSVSAAPNGVVVDFGDPSTHF